MLAQIKSWENSQGTSDEEIMMKRIKKKHRTLEERAKEYGDKLGPYEEFDWGEPVGRES